MQLFIDDIRIAPHNFVTARSSDEAIDIVKTDWPTFISFDHDLGGDDTSMVFLKRLVKEVWTNQPVPDYVVHSMNPIGSKNIVSFMESWKRSVNM